ncbi:hypothetical protein KEJ37_08000 [Candidatus Bathyarchaeota archaeon]|nr:hypothetical protein [Candidatus Bathyarchaeota archaeon]
MERFSYRHAFSKSALRLYEDYAEVMAWFDELKFWSGRTAHDYLDVLAGFVKALENHLKN